MSGDNQATQPSGCGCNKNQPSYVLDPKDEALLKKRADLLSRIQKTNQKILNKRLFT